MLLDEAVYHIEHLGLGIPTSRRARRQRDGPLPPSLAAVVRDGAALDASVSPATISRHTAARTVRGAQEMADIVEFEDGRRYNPTCCPGPLPPARNLLCVASPRPSRRTAGRSRVHYSGLILILALAALFLENAPPRPVLAAGAGAGSAVAADAIAVHAAGGLLRQAGGAPRQRPQPGYVGSPTWLRA